MNDATNGPREYERENFEAAQAQKGVDISRTPSGTYRYAATRRLWIEWLAISEAY